MSNKDKYMAFNMHTNETYKAATLSELSKKIGIAQPTASLLLNTGNISKVGWTIDKI